MSRTVNFTVDPRLAALLGESYRSTEAALKELVDNAWDAEAHNIWIDLPAAVTNSPIVIRDDGVGMTPAQIENEYINIARDRRSAKGKYSPRLKRRIKGRKGIGKFAGLAAANNMTLETVSNNVRSTLKVDKGEILNADRDLEQIPLPLTETSAEGHSTGTTITLTNLDHALNFPSEDAMRALLTYEYGREANVSIYVNDKKISVSDLPGVTITNEVTLEKAGTIRIRFTIVEGRAPKAGGFIVGVGGKIVGTKPQWFGLDEDPNIPEALRKKLYGEIDVESDELESAITSDWGAIVENSKLYKFIKDTVRSQAADALNKKYYREMSIQKARTEKAFQKRLERLPEHRRDFADRAISQVLAKFYGEQSDRIDTVISVILDAMERDEYWSVLKNIESAKAGDVENFAEALEQFGLVEMTLLVDRANARVRFLDSLEELVLNDKTLEADVHKAIENNLWILGAPYHFMSSNKTLKRVISEYCDKKFGGKRASKRPDLLLNQDPGDRYLLIEFKRPIHTVARSDEAQAQQYADDLRAHFPAKPIDIVVMGGKRAQRSDSANGPKNLRVHSYLDLISRARHEVTWLTKHAFA